MSDASRISFTSTELQLRYDETRDLKSGVLVDCLKGFECFAAGEVGAWIDRSEDSVVVMDRLLDVLENTPGVWRIEFALNLFEVQEEQPSGGECRDSFVTVVRRMCERGLPAGDWYLRFQGPDGLSQFSLLRSDGFGVEELS